jgi:para-nitrobenzyl esterase
MTKLSWFVLSLALTSAACHEQPSAPRASGSPETLPNMLVVATEHGRVRGSSLEETDVFRGIPYAAPPLGELRFRPPQPPAAWDGVRDAITFGSRCPQVGVMSTVIGDEDCLTLNLWRPSAPSTLPRPVLVFIHGGANAIGSGSDPLHDGRWLAKNRDVIVVTINYRLGLLGFLAHPELTAESGTSGNWAYLDQIAALEWIARNIAAFGGDPGRVTIVGESAGALSVCILLASPRAAGLFNAAIMQSGGCDVATLAQREREGERLANRSGCALEPDPVECLRSKSAAQLVELAPSVTDDISTWALPIGGAIDGFVLPASPWDAFAAGTHNVVPTLVGSNADETEMLTPTTLSGCPAYELGVRETFGQLADEVLTEYPCSQYAGGRHAYVAVTTDAIFTCQARRVLRSLAPAAAKTATPLFRYYYTYVRADPAIHKLRAFHGSEIQLLFDTMTRFGYKPPARERVVADAMQTSWAAIAAFGSPIHEGTPFWAPYEVARDNAVLFDAPLAALDGVGTSHCDFWDARSQSGNL